MKLFPALLGIAAAGVAGYLLEPTLRPHLVPGSGKEEKAETGPDKAPATTADMTPAPEQPEPVPAPEPVPVPPPAEPALPAAPEWVAALTPEQLPEKVSLKQRAEFALPGSSEPAVLPPGASVTPVRVEGSDLVVSPFAGPIEGKIPVMATDLVELLGNQPPAAEPEMVAEPELASEEPAPPAEPEPVVSAALGSEQIVAAMQDSIKKGSIEEFTFEQVLEWVPGEGVERDGKSYQSGTVTYKAETIFGVKNIEAQALIDGGKVVLWIWPKSGMEIK